MAADLGAWGVFEDESGQGLRPPKGRTWGRRGHPRVVRVPAANSPRLSLAALLATRPGHRPRLIYRTHTARRSSGRREGRRGGRRKGLTEADYATLLDAAPRQLGGPIVLVWDNLNTHVSAAMTELIAARPWLMVYRLPPYAHELNPVEPVWAHLKRSLANLTKHTIAELTVLVKTRLTRMQYRPGYWSGFSPVPARVRALSVTPALDDLWTGSRYVAARFMSVGGHPRRWSLRLGASRDDCGAHRCWRSLSHRLEAAWTPIDVGEAGMGELAVASLGPEALTAALEALPDGLVIFDAEWTVCFINRAGAALVGRRADELTGRSIWVASPEMSGTIFHSFLLHARGAGKPVTWRGFYAPAGRWLSATAVVVGELLQVSVREVTSRLAEPVEDGGELDQADDDGDRDRLRFLAEVSESLITTLDTGKSAAKLAELAVSRLCDWAVVALVGEDGGPGEEAWAHRDPARRADVDTYVTGRLRGTGDDEAMVDALMSGQPVQMIPVREDLVAPSLPTEEVRAAWRRLQTASYTIVPLRARGETFGALVLLNSGDRPPHTEAEIATAVEVARRGALALDNARLYGRQQKVAEPLQRSLLPPPPQPDDLQIAVRYRPAGAHQQVGGDWYDAFQQPDGATLLVIGDVVGHNVDAAAAMGQIRSILRGLACDRPESPARILSRVDRVLTTLGVPSLATALLARIEQPAELATEGLRRLRWSSAGHLPPLLLRPDGTVLSLASPPERLLGSGSPCARSDQEVLLSPGDTVVFYTDGLIEYGRTGIDEGIDRLAAQLTDRANLPLEDLCDRLLSRVPTGRSDDDIAILALRCSPVQQPDQQPNAAGSSQDGVPTGRSPASAPGGPQGLGKVIM